MAEVGTSTTIIKIAPNGSETRLQRYYRERVENLEAERAEIVKAVLDAAPSQEEVHKARWDLIVKQDELEELQRALGKANLYLLDQKKMMLVLKAENENLAGENELQSRQINHLMSLLPPVHGNEVTFFQELAPAPTRRRGRGARGSRGTASTTKENSTPASSTSVRSLLRAATGHTNTGAASRGAVGHGEGHKAAVGARVQHMEDVVASQALEIDRLQSKLHTMEALGAQRSHVLEESFNFRAKETEVRCAQLKGVVADLERKLVASKAKIKDLTIHAIESKKDIDGREHQQLVENQKLRETNTKVVKQLKFERQLRKVNSSSQTGGAGGGAAGLKVPEVLRGADDKRLPSAKVAFQEARRAQVKLQEKQRENRRLAVAFEEKMRENSKAVEFWKRKFQRLDARRALEFKGWRTDVDLLRQKLLQLESVWAAQEEVAGDLAGGGHAAANFARLRYNAMSPGMKPQKFEREMQAVRAKLEAMSEHYKVQLVSEPPPASARDWCPYCSHSGHRPTVAGGTGAKAKGARGYP